jgi:CRP-like cAMP-binding protein
VSQDVAEHVEHAVEAGAVVAAEGDLGDKFFVVESGTAEITRACEPVAKLRAGDFFGEVRSSGRSGGPPP